MEYREGAVSAASLPSHLCLFISLLALLAILEPPQLPLRPMRLHEDTAQTPAKDLAEPREDCEEGATRSDF